MGEDLTSLCKLSMLGVATAAAAALATYVYASRDSWRLRKPIRPQAVDDDRMAHIQAVINVLQKYSGLRVLGPLLIPDPGNKGHTEIDLLVITRRKLYVVEVKWWTGTVKRGAHGSWWHIKEDGSSVNHEDIITQLEEKVDLLICYISRRGLNMDVCCFQSVVVIANHDCRVQKVRLPWPQLISLNEWESFLSKETKKYAFQWADLRKRLIPVDVRRQVHAILKTAPTWDRICFNNELVLFGSFMQFKGSNEDMHSLCLLKRSTISNVAIVQGGSSTVDVHCTERDYRCPATLKKVNKVHKGSDIFASVSRATLVVFQAVGAKVPQEFLLDSIVFIYLSASRSAM